MSVGQLLSNIQSLHAALENATSTVEELLHCCRAEDSENLSIESIGEMWGLGRGLHVDGSVTISDYLEMVATEMDNIKLILL